MKKSYGHPYLMQLFGYFAVEELRHRDKTAGHVLDIDILQEIETIAITEYERRVLRPMIDELSPLEVAYLKAMNACLDDDRLAKSGEIAVMLAKSKGQLSKARERLIGSGIIASPERGMLMNCVPYLSAYVTSERDGRFRRETRRVARAPPPSQVSRR